MYSAGVDLGGTLTKVALVSSAGRIIQIRRLPTVAQSHPKSAIAEIAKVLESMAERSRIPFPPPGGVGIGIPGVVDWQRKRLVFSGPIGWRDLPLGDLMYGEVRCPVAIDTDVNAGALSDMTFGRVRDASELLYVSWGTGIGAGLVFSRRLYHSRSGAIGNLGHMLADEHSSRSCYCGCTGCLEIEAGGRAMVERALEAVRQGVPSVLSSQPYALTPEGIAQAAQKGDRLAQQVLSRSVLLMARVIGGVLALLNPDTVVFGGGVSRCLPTVWNLFESELRRRTPEFSLNSTRIVLSEFVENAGVIGASLLPRAQEITSEEVQ